MLLQGTRQILDVVHDLEAIVIMAVFARIILKLPHSSNCCATEATKCGNVTDKTD